MKTIETYKAYLDAKQAGDDVMSRAELDGFALGGAIDGNKDLVVVTIDPQCYSIVCYKKTDDKIRITAIRENVKHDLSIVLPETVLQKGNDCEWSGLFAIKDGKIEFDKEFASDYPLVPDAESKASESMNAIGGVVSQIFSGIKNSDEYYLRSKSYEKCLPFLYMIQEQTGKTIQIMPDYDVSGLKTEGLLAFPTDLKLVVGDNEIQMPADMSSFSEKFNIHLLLDDQTLNTGLVKHKGVDQKMWKDIISEHTASYTVADNRIAIIRGMSFETDMYQNIFVQINSERSKKILYNPIIGS